MRQSAAGGLARFGGEAGGNLPVKAEVDEDFYRPSHGSSMLGGNMFEDEGRLVMDWKCRGMEKNEFDMRCGITRS